MPLATTFWETFFLFLIFLPHDRGKLSDDEFASEKARLLGAGEAPPAKAS